VYVFRLFLFCRIGRVQISRQNICYILHIADSDISYLAFVVEGYEFRTSNSSNALNHPSSEYVTFNFG